MYWMAPLASSSKSIELANTFKYTNQSTPAYNYQPRVLCQRRLGLLRTVFGTTKVMGPIMSTSFGYSHDDGRVAKGAGFERGTQSIGGGA